MLLEDKHLLITGVLTPGSIAFKVAEACQREGATVYLTSFGRVMSLTQRAAKRLPTTPVVLELDAASPEHFDALTAHFQSQSIQLDGALHAIAFAPPSALGGNFLTTPWEDVAQTLRVSTYSLKELVRAVLPVAKPSCDIVALDFDNSRQAWPTYDWMGVAKAAMVSTVRYLARDVGERGMRVNAVAAGPIATMSAKSIPGYAEFQRIWTSQSPLGWSTNTDEAGGAVARAVMAFFAGFYPLTTGEVIHVDGGYHSQGAPRQTTST